MAGGTISTKMELQGEQEYRKAIREITQDSKTLASEMKAVTSGFDSNASAQKKAAAQMEVLNKQIQTQEVRDMSDAELDAELARYGLKS